MNTPTITTERLILRKFNEQDIPALYLLLQDEQVNTFLPWFPVKSMEEATAFFQERFARNYQKDCAYHYAICLKDDPNPIGYVNVNMQDDSHDLGYGLRKEYWHKGIVTEAAKAVVEQLKRDRIAYVTATHDINNPRSGGVMKQIGMIYRYSYEELVQPKNVLVTFRMYQMNLDEQQDRVFERYWKVSDVHFVEQDLCNGADAHSIFCGDLAR